MLKIKNAIEEANKIIILTHVYPDVDAIGSQFGLKQLILDNYPDKKVFTSGEKNKYNIDYELDNLNDSDFIDATIITVDVGNTARISDQRYNLGKKLIKIDHHIKTESYGDIEYVDTELISTCSIITQFALKFNFKVSKEAATFLFYGLVTDSGRFLYNRVDKDTFKEAAFLLEKGVEISKVYDKLYVSSLNSKRLAGFVLSNFIIDNKVAYIKFDKEFTTNYQGELTELKSGTINLMANIEDVPIWATFTEYLDKIFVEIRGKISVVDIAYKHGGGGHKLACGTAVNSWSEVETIIEELKERSNEYYTK